jgi:hypothetical protein
VLTATVRQPAHSFQSDHPKHLAQFYEAEAFPEKFSELTGIIDKARADSAGVRIFEMVALLWDRGDY